MVILLFGHERILGAGLAGALLAPHLSPSP